MFTRLLYPILILAINFYQVMATDQQDHCPSVDPAMSVPKFWPWAKQKLVEEIGQNDQNDNKLISDFVDDLAEEDEFLEHEMKLQEPKMGKNDLKREKPKIKKWFHKTINFRRSKTMKHLDKNTPIDEQQDRSDPQTSSSLSPKWLRSFSFRRPSSKNLNSGEVFRSYSMHLNPDKIGQLINDEENCENDRKMGMQLYKESKQLQREIMAGKNDPNCIVGKFEAITTQITKVMDTVAAKFGITMKKEYDIELEKTEKYSNQAMVRQMAKMWITVGKGGAVMDKNGVEKALEMLRSVMVMAESNLFLANTTGHTHRRRKRVEPVVIGSILVVVVVLAAVILIPIFFGSTPAKFWGKTCCGWL